jgi:rfaE bifunctional protein kinase chain/domain
MDRNKKVVFVSGNFFALHPGHVRLLRFAAECGNTLVVGVSNVSPGQGFPPPHERAEALKELGFVDRVVLLDHDLAAFLKELKPDIVVKGKEFESRDNPEEPILNAYGGKLLFSSGESSYSARELLLRDAERDNRPHLVIPVGYATRHKCSPEHLKAIIQKFAGLKVVVVGDTIIDEYVNCTALGMSREDPTVVVSPQSTDRFIGGASIVAAHARAMGAEVRFVSVCGCDDPARYVREQLGALGVQAALVEDESRPTTLKQRFRAGGKTLLRVSHLRQHEIQKDLKADLLAKARAALKDAHLLIFSDFSYGALPQSVVEDLGAAAAKAGVLIAADSQSSSQLGDIARFKNAALLTPTEHEVRLSLRDQTGGVALIGHRLLEETNGSAAFVTLGPEGILVVTHVVGGPDDTDRLPAFNLNPVDVAGAGDSMLVAGAMTLAAGGSPWQAGFLGSIAAGIQTSRIGNVPIRTTEILDALS